jgi:hypothetical protein
MVDDDDPELPLAPAPEGRPADDKDTSTATEESKEQEQQASDDEETKKPSTDEQPDIGDEDEQDDDDEDDDATEEQKRASRAERYRRQAERLKAENEALRSRTSGNLPPDQAALQRAFEYRVWQEIGDPPKPEDFKDDYVGLSVARQAYETDRRAVTREVRREFQQQINQAQTHAADLVAEHKNRVDRFKTKVKDYEEVMAKATMHVQPHVERLLLHSKKSERLGYALAKNQQELARLNRMDPESAARRIGQLEARLSLPPQSKTQTQARPPIKPLKGSGASPPTGLSAVNNWMKKQYGDRAR